MRGSKIFGGGVCEGVLRTGGVTEKKSEQEKRVQENSPSVHDQGVLPRDNVGPDDGLAPGNQAPAHGAEGLVEYAPVLDLGEVDDAICRK